MPEGSRSTSASMIPELFITREFDAPRDLVFEAFTKAEHLVQWWGPVGLELHVEQLDLRPGGCFHYRMTVPGGGQMWGKFVYQEISQPERLVYVSAFADEEGRTIRAPFSEDFPLEIMNTLTFSEWHGKTALTLRGTPVDPTDAEREMFESMFDSMHQGFGGTMDQLDTYLDQLQADI